MECRKMNKTIWQTTIIKYHNADPKSHLQSKWKLLKIMNSGEIEEQDLKYLDDFFPFLEAESKEEAHALKERIKKEFGYTENEI